MTKLPRIAFCIDSLRISGGTELNAVRSAEQLRRRGYEIILVTMSKTSGGMFQRYRDLDIPVFTFPVSSLVSLSARAQLSEIAACFLRERVSVVHTHDCYTNFLMTIAASRAGIASIASKRWVDYAQRRHFYTDAIGFSLADQILANSVAVASTITSQTVGRRAKITVIPNFVDDEAFSTMKARTEFRSRFGFTDQDVVFSMVARLRPEKNHAVLLKAFNIVLQENPNVRLLLVGDGPYERQIARMIGELGLHGIVTLAGHLSEAWRAYAAADVAMLTSDHEGFPNSVVEAMAAGLPVIATDVGGIPEAVVSGVTGELVPPNNAAQLAKVMLLLSQNSAQRERLGRAGQQRAQALFGAPGVIDRLESLYQKVQEPRREA